jgi:CHASE3 domain sensor protein
MAEIRPMRRLLALAAFATIGLTTILLGWCVVEITITTRAADVSQSILVAAENVKYSLIEAQSGARGFIITGDERYLNNEYRNAIATNVERLQTLRNAMGQDEAADIVKLVLYIVDRFERAIKLRQDDGFDAARAFISTYIGQQTIKHLEGMIQNIQDAEAQQALAATRFLRLLSQIVICGMITLLACAGFLIIFPWGISRKTRRGTASNTTGPG